MPWFKVDDGLWSDAHMMSLTDGALALWLKAGTYSAGKLLDGFIPSEALKFLQTRKRYVDELVAKGIWVWHPAGSALAEHWQCAGGWLAVDWRENALSRDEVLAKRNESKQRVRAYRNAARNAASNAAPDPDPVPVPEPIPEPEERGACEVRPVVRVAPKPANAPTEPTYVRVWKAYAEAVGIHPVQLGAPKYGPCRMIEAAAAAEAGANSGAQFDAALKRLITAWRADPWVQAENPSLAHLAGNLGKYAPGVTPAAAKPLVPAREQLAAARERTLEAQRLVNRLDAAPWHDRKYIGRDGVEYDRKLHLECVEKAKAELAKARDAEHALRVQLREAS